MNHCNTCTLLSVVLYIISPATEVKASLAVVSYDFNPSALSIATLFWSFVEILFVFNSLIMLNVTVPVPPVNSMYLSEPSVCTFHLVNLFCSSYSCICCSQLSITTPEPPAPPVPLNCYLHHHHLYLVPAVPLELYYHSIHLHQSSSTTSTIEVSTTTTTSSCNC